MKSPKNEELHGPSFLAERRPVLFKSALDHRILYPVAFELGPLMRRCFQDVSKPRKRRESSFTRNFSKGVFQAVANDFRARSLNVNLIPSPIFASCCSSLK
jgi:hypothetical protein